MPSALSFLAIARWENDMTIGKFLRRFMSGLLSKDASVAAGIVLGLVVWTLTRIVNEVVDSPTVEYDVSYSAATVANGQAGARIMVALTNLSRDSTLQNLGVTIYDPSGKATFIPDSIRCAFPPPLWAQDGVCLLLQSGLKFQAPWFTPDSQLHIAIDYVGSVEAGKRPIVRILPSRSSPGIRLVEKSWKTWVARYQFTLLCGLLMVVFALYAVAVAAGATDPT
ncbi:hypothetical protein C5O80_31770 [Burkholderia sp. SRS-46]|nr:hypothetical protein C5O80_31770 [Burkholderia sp. SRS-46]